MSGRSQQVRTRRGVERGSVPIYRLVVVQPVSEFHFNQVRLTKAIRRLWAVELVHNHFAGDNQIVGNSITVGIKIFSIVGG